MSWIKGALRFGANPYSRTPFRSGGPAAHSETEHTRRKQHFRLSGMLLRDASRFGASALRFGAEAAASTPKRSLVSKTARTTSPDTENPDFGWPRGPYNTRAGYAALLFSLSS